MKSRLHDKYKAIELRKEGLSYKEIISQIGVSKGTLSGWLKNLDLSDKQMERLRELSKEKSDKGRAKAVLVNREKKLSRVSETTKEATMEFEKYKDNPFFLIGLSLYWAEGSKKNTNNYSFINSDPDMVRFMFLWTQKFLCLDKSLYRIRLFIHLPYREENLEYYWSKILDMEEKLFQKTIYKPTPHILKKNPSYKGCLRFYMNGVRYLRKVMVWQDLLVKNFIL